MNDYDLTSISDHVANKEKITNHSLVLQSTSNKGEGFWGTVIFGKIKGDNKSLDVVFKYSHRDSEVHKKLPLRNIFLNEIRFYEVIIPSFIKFQEEHKIMHPFNNVPMLYASIKEPLNELLVLENIKVNNFDVWNRKRLMDENHMLVAMSTLAKFHGTSLAIQNINPDLYKSLSAGMTDMFQANMEVLGFYEQLTQCLKGTLSMFDPIAEKVYYEKFEKLANTVQEAMISAFNFHYHDVILHGDCFNNNVMFQYKDLNNRNDPKCMMMMDFQMAKLGSPALDLVFFFYSRHRSKEDMDRLDYILQYYHDQMKDHLEKFNLEMANIFPFEELLEHWKNVCLFGLIISFTVRKAMFVNDDDAPDLADNTEDFISGFRLSSNDEKLYLQQMKEVVIHFIERNYI